jgi:15-cis-phytoene desaturase
MRVVVAGGGLAGLTCAKFLVEAGHDVAVVEGLPFLGGRASTWRDEDGDIIEQGLHLFLGAYSEFRALLRDIGRDPGEVLAWTTQIRFQDPEGPTEAMFSIDPLRAPGATLASVLGNNDYLGPKDKLALIPLVAPGLQGYEHLRRTYDQQTVAEMWSKIGNETVMRRFLRPFCRGIQFSEPEDFSAFDFLTWIHQVTRHPANVHVAGYKGARGDTIFAPMAAWLTTRGAQILLRRPVASLSTVTDKGELRADALELRNGERIEGDVFVMAVPAWELLPLLPPELQQMGFFQDISTLPTAPAISAQLWFDGDRVSSKEYTLVAGSRAPVYQDQSTTAYPDARGSRLSVIISPADQLLEASDSQIVAEVMASLRPVEPALRGVEPRKVVILRHAKHLIRPLPGAMSRRPTQVTPVPNLFLAGDWTQQDFLGSQEGAVRGGKRAAEAIQAALGERGLSGQRLTLSR